MDPDGNYTAHMRVLKKVNGDQMLLDIKTKLTG